MDSGGGHPFAHVVHDELLFWQVAVLQLVVVQAVDVSGSIFFHVYF